MDDDPYVFAINDGEVFLYRDQHATIAQRLTDAGYDVGLMLWTASVRDYTPTQIRNRWKVAMKRAGITRIDSAYDAEKMRVWFRIYPRPDKVKK